MKLCFSVDGGEGNSFLVSMEPFEKSVLPDELESALHGIEILDVTLERSSGESNASARVLNDISTFIASVFFDNPKSILYFYCDDIHEVPGMSEKKNMLPQAYRSRLFSRMFERYVSVNHIEGVQNYPIEIHLEDREIFIHLISTDDNLPVMRAIGDAILGMKDK